MTRWAIVPEPVGAAGLPLLAIRVAGAGVRAWWELLHLDEAVANGMNRAWGEGW